MVLAIIQIRGFKCDVCGHEWISRKWNSSDNELPIACAKCKSPYWNKNSRKKSIEEDEKKKQK